MSESKSCQVELEGTFDRLAAERLAVSLQLVQPGGRFEVDLTRVQEFQDLALALLARTLEKQRDGVVVSIRGLHDRQIRLLRYFDIALDTPLPLDDDLA
jgi:ABC-type transporter Mla MlaB component